MSIKPAAGDNSALEWLKSSYSTNEGPACVEVAAAPDAVLVRDSKVKDGHRLGFEAGAWDAFVAFAGGA